MLLRYFTWAFHDRGFPAGIDAINRRLVGATLVHRDFLRNIVGLHGLVKEAHGCSLVAPGRQQEVDRLAFLVYFAVEIFPDAFDLDIGFVHAPTPAHRAFMFAKDFFKQGKKPDRPAID